MTGGRGTTITAERFTAWPVILTVIVLLLVATVLLARKLGDPHTANPVAEAEIARAQLLDRIDPGPGAAVSDSGLGVTTPILTRDLFAPAQATRPARPVAPAHARRARVRPPALSAILIDGASRQAMIGGRLVGEGQTVEGFTVVSISSRSVLLARGDNEHCLTLWETP